MVVPALVSLRVALPAKRFVPATRTESRTVVGALTVIRARRPRLRSVARCGRVRVLTASVRRGAGAVPAAGGGSAAGLQ